MMSDQLQTISEIAVAVAGFAGVAAALSRNPSPLNDFEKMNLWFVFTNSVSVFISSQTYLVLSLSMEQSLALEIAFPILGVFAVLALLAASFYFTRMKEPEFRALVLATVAGRFIAFGGGIAGIVITTLSLLSTFGFIERMDSVYVGVLSAWLLSALAHFSYFIATSAQNR